MEPNVRYPVFPPYSVDNLDEYGQPMASIDIDHCEGKCIRGPHERGRHYHEYAEVTIFEVVNFAHDHGVADDHAGAT